MFNVWWAIDGLSFAAFILFTVLGIRKQNPDWREGTTFIAVGFGFLAFVAMTLGNI